MPAPSASSSSTRARRVAGDAEPDPRRPVQRRAARDRHLVRDRQRARRPARAGRGGHPPRDRHAHRARRADGEPHRRDADRARRPRRDGRRPPRLRARRPRDRGQRHRIGDAARDRAPDGGPRHRAAQHRALRVVGRRGGRPRRIAVLRRLAHQEPGEGHRAVPQLRHDRLAELRPVHLRRQRRRVRHQGPERQRQHRADLRGLLRLAGPDLGTDRVRRALGLRRVHHRRHSGRWPVHGCRGRQERGAGRTGTADSPRSTANRCRTTRATTRHATAWTRSPTAPTQTSTRH